MGECGLLGFTKKALSYWNKKPLVVKVSTLNLALELSGLLRLKHGSLGKDINAPLTHLFSYKYMIYFLNFRF